MSLKALLGLEDTNLSDVEILAKVKEALDKDLDSVEFAKPDGSTIVVKLPHTDFGKYIDPWDGQGGKNNYPHI